MKNSFQVKAADVFVTCGDFTASVCRLRNTSAVSIDYKVGEVTTALAAGAASGAINVSNSTREVSVRRTDLNSSAVSVLIEWGLTADEAYELASSGGDSVSDSHNTAPDAHADIRAALAGKQDAGNFAGSSTPGGAATTALECTGNAATATTAASCTGNSVTATTASSCSGNAATATALETARTLTIGSKANTFDGSANVSWTLAEMGADPAGTADAAVSAHNTAPDAHADIRADLAGKQDSLTISTVGTALLNLSTPTAQKIPRINADGSVTLIDVPKPDLWSASCVQWWFDSGSSDTQGLAGLVSITGTDVHAWGDRSTHALCAVQAGSPPTWVASAINGHGAVRSATGTSQCLRARVRLYQSGLVGDFSAFALTRRSATSGLGLVWGRIDSPRLSLFTSTDDSGEIQVVVAGSQTLATDYTPSTNWELIEVRYRSGTTSFFINGVLLQSVVGTLSHAVTSDEWDLFLGGYDVQGCTVDLAACVLLDGRATDSFCDSVRTWLLDFGGL